MRLFHFSLDQSKAKAKAMESRRVWRKTQTGTVAMPLALSQPVIRALL